MDWGYILEYTHVYAEYDTIFSLPIQSLYSKSSLR
jgi:hypothetical protein